MATRIGTTITTGLAVYQRADGSLFTMEDGLRVDMHGSTMWKTKANKMMRGERAASARPTKTIKKRKCSDGK